MPKKPNYDFERREREKAKALKKEERAKAKSERKVEPESPVAGEQETAPEPQ